MILIVLSRMILATLSATTITIGLLQVLGSLGVFLFGMKILSEAVQRLAGKRMRQALAGLTGNRFSGIFTGFLTTSLGSPPRRRRCWWFRL